MAMHRTQVYLEDDLVLGLQRLARQRGTTMAALIRQSARRLLEEAAEPIEPWGANDPIWDLLGMIEKSEPSDDSMHVDDIVYDYDREFRPASRVAEERTVYPNPNRPRRR